MLTSDLQTHLQISPQDQKMQEGMLSLMQVKQGMTRTLLGLNIHRCYLFQGGMAFRIWAEETI